MLRELKSLKRIKENGSSDFYVGIYRKAPYSLKFFRDSFSEQEIALLEFLSKNESIHFFTPVLYGRNKGKSYLISKWVDGLSLGEFEKLSPYWAVHFMRLAVNGLYQLEKSGFIHGDISPGNLIITPTLTPVWIDCSLKTMGTPYFSARERFASEKASIASDIYSCGMLLYELITKKFSEEPQNFDFYADFANNIDSFTPTENLYALGISPSELKVLEPIWKGCLKKSPEERLSSFEELEELLEIAEESLAPFPLKIEEEALILKNFINSRKKTFDLEEEQNQKKIPFLKIILAFFTAILLIILFFIFSKPQPSIEETAIKMLEKSKEQGLTTLPKEEATPVPTNKIENISRPKEAQKDIYHE